MEFAYWDAAVAGCDVNGAVAAEREPAIGGAIGFPRRHGLLSAMKSIAQTASARRRTCSTWRRRRTHQPKSGRSRWRSPAGNCAGASARSPVSGMKPRSRPSAATLNTKFGPRPRTPCLAGGAARGRGVPRAGAAAAAPAAAAGVSPPRRRDCRARRCARRFPRAAALPCLARRRLPSPDAAAAQIRRTRAASAASELVARVSGSVMPPGHVGDPAYSRAPAA